ncbi:Tyrosine kinase receptor Cad96Ca [Lucilia cuprina]|uniref:receptor protein-tyrosine kinase n=1 Tax=Lucilia cuprina TaxID=7375 RepID=A0A0L0CF47_LUCCU|nr:Tyrosine kinase receptor Cad96Ca [Lucilia cuprina]KNC31028.1 Tyrosine kinase receptor Cad96Ca [Lucilia cuprina]
MQSLKFSIFMAVIAVGITVVFVKPASSQEHAHVNSPPILIVPDRNWRISETEPVGQIISRIRADDSENDELIFGLEPAYKGTVNPFRIDPIGGVVYLNESLIGRGGENFFLYITVTDGQLTAKNEVFVNILSAKDNRGRGPRPPPPSISNVVQNISHFLPSFDRLPGVQSIRNQQPNRRPSNILPPGFNNIYPPPVLNFNPNQQLPMWPTNNVDENSDEQDNDYSIEMTTVTTANTTSETTSRTILTPISHHDTTSSESKNVSKIESTATTNSSSINGGKQEKEDTSFTSHSTNSTTIFYGFRSQMIPLVLTACGLFVAAAFIIGFLYRKRLCAFGKTLKKKSKEEMAKKSNQSNLSSSNLTDDSRNSMVLQHWNGPMAYGNRYVPWERDQQPQQQLHIQQQQQIMQQSIATSQISTSVANGGIGSNHPVSLGGVVGGPPSAVGNVAAGSSVLAGSIHTQQENFDGWEFPRHRLKFFNILGEGAFGQVWRCEATDIDGSEGVTTVAVKTIKENATEVEKKDLLSELEVMKSLEPHVNVVRFLGCCTDKDPIFVIIEYVNRGKLQTYLRSSRAERHYGNTHGKSNILTSGDLTSFMYQVAKGMDYLTSRGIIHRDLAARNVLIADDHTCKVADFGFARDVITSKVYERKSEGKLPIRWMAIESLYDNIFSVKSDIWSFGILMWEIVTLGSTPYPGISASDVMRKVRDGYRLEKPEHCRRELYNIMYYCWSQDPNERPSFGELVKMLDKLLHTEMDYIELERFPDHNYYNIVSLSGEKV